MKVVSPRAAALRILSARSELARDVGTSYPLADFQREGAARAATIMEHYGGVIIADSVGLGKTYVAAALIERCANAGGRIALAIPAGLRSVWRHALRPVAVQHPEVVTFVSHGQLSGGFATSHDYALVVVDEAHAFRNPRTQRYRALRLVCRNSSVALLTATPVNNSLTDLLSLINLFARDDSFRDIGIPSLSSIFDDPPDRRAIDRLRQAIIIRRGRAGLRRRYPEICLPTGETLQFPRSVRLTTVTHTPLIEACEIESFLDRARFAVYQHDYNRALLGMSLLKRIQSGSRAAFVSIDRLIALHIRFLDALRAGRLLQARALPRADDDQLALDELLLPAVPATLNIEDLRAVVIRDLVELRAFRARLAAAPDAKPAALIGLLGRRPRRARTVVFSEFRDTAEQLWHVLMPNFRVALVTGSGAWLGSEQCARNEVIRLFAPIANRALEPAPARRVDVLIATDVMAEGLNLQDADAVVSYDLPWNPVRLIQRAGRVDRIGSAHDLVEIYNFLPDRDLEEVLGLLKRLRRKLHDLKSAVGHDSAVLEEDEVPEGFFNALAAGDRSVLDDAPAEFGHVDVAEAGPVGCAASLSATPRRVLACFSADTQVRELIWDGAHCLEDKAMAREILLQALDSVRVRPPGPTPQAVASCHAYLDTEKRLPGNHPGIPALANAIRGALFEYGLAAPTNLIDAAEQTLADLGGLLDPLAARRRIEAAATPAELLQALNHVASQCRKQRYNAPSWRLVATIAAD